MASRPLQRIGLEEAKVVALSKIGILTCSDLLTASPITLMSCCDLSYEQSLALILYVSEKVVPKSITALQLFHQRQQQTKFVSSGYAPLDQALKGGYFLGSITDVCGAPGVGKTQLCLTCVVQELKDIHLRSSSSSSGAGGDGSVVYIDAELKLDANRIVQIAVKKFPALFSVDMNLAAPHNIDNILNRIQVVEKNFPSFAP